ncbi:MAG TPA: glycosyl hydrolase family 18 protein, partial [Bacteroidota bacterium]|nr:glycosyl hydrolase family 18 protein [Bacteroidota bacterium]
TCGGAPGREFAVIAYYNGHGRGLDAVPAGKLTHIIYSFLHLSGNRLVLNTQADSAGIARLVSLREVNPRLKVLVSVGGWGGCAPCSGAFSSEAGREEFARSALELLRRVGADGLDIDWEYPAIEGYPGHPFSPADRHNFTLLMRALREALGDRYELSFAAGGFTRCILESYEWTAISPLVNAVNVMTYDLVNANSTTTGHLTPLYGTPGQEESVVHAVHLLDSLGVPREKIVIGAAFYARLWEEVPDTNNGLFQPGRFFRFLSYRDIGGYLRQHDGFRTFLDTAAAAAYSYSARDRLFATYDDVRSVALKASFAMTMHLGGIMFWELSGDLPDHPLLEAIDSVRTASGKSRAP